MNNRWKLITVAAGVLGTSAAASAERAYFGFIGGAGLTPGLESYGTQFADPTRPALAPGNGRSC